MNPHQVDNFKNIVPLIQNGKTDGEISEKLDADIGFIQQCRKYLTRKIDNYKYY